jgi:Ku protein
MAPRANWKGYLRLSLVSCPIALYPASSLSEKVSFNRINRKTGNRLKQQNIDAETGEVVSRDDTVRGYEVAKGQYMIVEDEEVEAVQIESTRTIDIDQFVPKDEIDERYIDSPYYIAPGWAGGSGSLCRHSGHHCKAEHGRAGPGGAGAARACDRARAEGPGPCRYDAALSLRGSG